MNGRACDAINTIEMATAAAKSPVAVAAAALLSQCTIAIAIRSTPAMAMRPIHFTQLIDERLTMIRWRRASSACSSEATISR